MIIDIEIPEDTRCLLKLGEKIDIGKPYLEKKVHQHLDIYISKDLGIKADKIFQVLKKLVGDTVKKNELIALKKDLFGEKKLLSPVDGTVKEIDHEQGKIILTIDEKEKKTYSAFFKGEVVSLKKNLLQINIGKGEEFPIIKISNSFGGGAYYLDKNNFFSFTSNDIKKRVIISESVNSLIRSKIEALGGIGIVTITKKDEMVGLPTAQVISQDDFKKIWQKKLSYCWADHQSNKIYFY